MKKLLSALLFLPTLSFGSVIVNPGTSGAGGGDSLGSHTATMTVTAPYGVATTSVTGTAFILTTSSASFYGNSPIQIGNATQFPPTSTTNFRWFSYQDGTLGNIAYVKTASATGLPSGFRFTDSVGNPLLHLNHADIAEGGGSVATTRAVIVPSTASIQMRDGDNSAYVAFRSSNTLVHNQNYVLPITTGTADQLLAIGGINSDNSVWTYWKTDTDTIGGGGGSSLAVSTSATTGYQSPAISSPTHVLGFHQTQFRVSLLGNATAFVAVDPSTFTMLGVDPTLGGALGGTISAATVDNDGHSHTGATLSGVDVSDDTNLTATGQANMNGDALHVGPTSLSTGTVGSLAAASIAAGTLGGSVVASSVSFASVTGHESTLEGVLDLDQLQGQIGDAQIADSAVDGGTGGEITDDSLTTADVGPDAVGASELTEAMNFVPTGAWDFGGGVLEIPNGTGPTVDATGEMALDTTDGSLVIYDGHSAKVIAHSTHSFTVTISSGNGWNGLSFPIWRAPHDMAVTITKVMAESLTANTTVMFQLDETTFGGTGSAGTDVFSVLFSSAHNQGVTTTTFSNAGIAAQSSLVFNTSAAGAAGGAPAGMTLTVFYLKDRE